MMTAYRLLLLAVLTLQSGQAAAQTLPWPTAAPQAATPAAPQATTPWTEGWPPASPLPAVPPCMVEFAKLRDDVQKRGLAAKAAGQRKASREEMCKLVTAYGAAELKWVEYTKANVTSCGIPAEVVSQLRAVHSNTENTKERICAVVRGPGFDVPNLGSPLLKLPSPAFVD